MFFWISFAIASCIENKTVTVRGDSMSPTYKNNQEITLENNFYLCSKVRPSKDDIITFKHLDQEYLKRIVAVEGDILKFKNGFLIVNEKTSKVSLSKKEEKLLSLYNPVPKDSVIVIGDNLNSSKDSRSFGAISISSILAKVK